MCGRTGLTLCAADVQGACAYKRNNKKGYEKPTWRDEFNLGKEYSPSYNIAPTEITPVLVSAYNFGIGETTERIIKPMMWGMIPPWHEGSYKSHGLSTNNCRLENIVASKLYGSSLKEGNRCVILAEGFYEWQTTNSTKQPYYIYSSQDKEIKMDDATTWKNEFHESKGWNGINLLKMAGVYNSWNCEEGTVYSYSVITMESNDSMNWLHHRMPAILETDQQVANWLDADQIPYQTAISILKPVKKLFWHPVSTSVNNARNKSLDCNKRVTPEDLLATEKAKAKKFGSRSVMDSWLKKKSSDTEGSGPCSESKKSKPNM